MDLYSVADDFRLLERHSYSFLRFMEDIYDKGNGVFSRFKTFVLESSEINC